MHWALQMGTQRVCTCSNLRIPCRSEAEQRKGPRCSVNMQQHMVTWSLQHSAQLLLGPAGVGAAAWELARQPGFSSPSWG